MNALAIKNAPLDEEGKHVKANRSKSGVPWVVAGGKPGELGHCERCGIGLELNLPQPLPIVTAVMKAFIVIHESCADKGRVEPRPVTPREWRNGRDTGTSSLTIWSVVTGFPSPHGHYDVPYDPSDFGRCYRLLALFPDWLSKLPKVAAKYPQWEPFVCEWSTLTAMYEKALSSKDGGEMYQFMQKLRVRP